MSHFTSALKGPFPSTSPCPAKSYRHPPGAPSHPRLPPLATSLSGPTQQGQAGAVRPCSTRPRRLGGEGRQGRDRSETTALCLHSPGRVCLCNGALQGASFTSKRAVHGRACVLGTEVVSPGWMLSRRLGGCCCAGLGCPSSLPWNHSPEPEPTPCSAHLSQATSLSTCCSIPAQSR